MKKLVIAVAILLMVSGCTAPAPELSESASEEAMRSSEVENSVQYEALSEAWIELASIPYGSGSISFGFEELPDEGSYPVHQEGVFYSGPVEYKDFIYIMDEAGNPVTKYHLNLPYSEEDSYNVFLSGDHLFLNQYINIFQINLLDGTYEYYPGMVYTSNGAVIISTFTTDFDENDLSGEMQVDVWVDGKIAHTFLTPVDVRDYNTYGIAQNPEYLPKQDTLIFYDPAHKYTFTLSTGAAEWEHNFPNPPIEIMETTTDLRYSISRVRYDPMSVGDYYYCYDAETGSVYPLAVVLNGQASVNGPYVILTDAIQSRAFELSTGNELSLEEIG